MNIFLRNNFRKSKRLYHLYYFSLSQKLTGRDKMNMILDRQKYNNEKYSEENKLFEKKTSPLFKYMYYLRTPIYITTFGVIWLNPFTTTYSLVSLFTNYYMIFLTCMEGTSIFSLGLIDYLLVKFNVPDNTELIKYKYQNNNKRLFIMIYFFLFLIISGYLASNNNTSSSYFLIMLLNIYLYIKFSKQIGSNIVNPLYFIPRMKFIYTNMLFSAFLMLISYKKNSLIDNNIKY